MSISASRDMDMNVEVVGRRVVTLLLYGLTVCTLIRDVDSFQLATINTVTTTTASRSILSPRAPTDSRERIRNVFPISGWTILNAKRGFGGGGGMGMGVASTSSKKKGGGGKNKNKKAASGPENSPKSLEKQLRDKYGGTTPQDISRGTQALINQQISSLPPLLQEALGYHKELLEWDRRLDSMDLLAQSNLHPSDVQHMNKMRDSLTKILAEISSEYQINISTRDDLQVLMQQITWNASADAKAIKSITGRMPKDIEHRVERASQYAAEQLNSLQAATKDVNNNSEEIPSPKVLDVGCGYGVMTPYLKKAGISPSQIHGIDLSVEMIRNARNIYCGGNKKNSPQFDVMNFMDITTTSTTDRLGKVQKELDGGRDHAENDNTIATSYGCIVFCASLHDLPDMKKALLKGRDILLSSGLPSGRLIIVHPQGASHVEQQSKANPVLVPRKLPTGTELKDWLCTTTPDSHQTDDSSSSSTTTAVEVELVVSPADAKSQQEIREGYLAVLDLRVVKME